MNWSCVVPKMPVMANTEVMIGLIFNDFSPINHDETLKVIFVLHPHQDETRHF